MSSTTEDGIQKTDALSVTTIEQSISGSSLFTEGGMIKNLSSLKFNAGVNEPEKGFLYLRKRNRMLTINLISHAVFFTAILEEIKKRSSEYTQTQSDKSRLQNRIQIGLIGCGRLGSHLINAFIDHNKIPPKNFKISTRRPESILDNFRDNGVTFFYDNAEAASKVDILFLCCPPQQTDKVLHEIKGKINTNCLVYSMVAGYPVSKICKVIKHKQVFKPTYHNYRKENYKDAPLWNYNTTISNALAIQEFREMTCPLHTVDNKHGINMVEINNWFLHCLFLYGLNVCLDNSLDLNDSVRLCNIVMFKDHIGFQLDSIIQLTESSNSTILYDVDNKRFMLNEFSENILNKMNFETSAEFYENFTKHYKKVFDRFIDWRVF